MNDFINCDVEFDLQNRKEHRPNYANTLKREYFNEGNKKLIILGLWEAIVTSVNNQNLPTGGRDIKLYVSGLPGISSKGIKLVSRLHTCRNLVAHCNMRVRDGVDNVIEAIDGYDWDVALFENDLKLLTKETNIKLSAKHIIRALGTKEEKKKSKSSSVDFDFEDDTSLTDIRVDLGDLRIDDI